MKYGSHFRSVAHRRSILVSPWLFVVVCVLVAGGRLACGFGVSHNNVFHTLESRKGQDWQLSRAGPLYVQLTWIDSEFLSHPIS